VFGSTRDARRAGSQLATSAALPRLTTVNASTVASNELTPNSCDDNRIARRCCSVSDATFSRRLKIGAAGLVSERKDAVTKPDVDQPL
jgi:hypothetical protein